MCDCKNKNDFSELINPSNCYTNPCNKICPIDPKTCSDETTYKQQVLSCSVPLQARLIIEKYGKETQVILNKMMPVILNSLKTGNYSGLNGQTPVGWVFRIFSQTGVLLFSSILGPVPDNLFTLLLAKCVTNNEIKLLAYQIQPTIQAAVKQNNFKQMAATDEILYGSTTETAVSTTAGPSADPVVTVESIYYAYSTDPV